jgi:triacylglycerol esterase/lipase EstA (alpha/beta hydrolase family)
MSYVNSVTVYPSSVTITKGKWYYGAYASISSDCPECAEVEWYSNSPAIASVNKTTGYIYGVSTGTTRIYAEATDGSGKKDYITVTVAPPVSVTGISICPTSLTLNVCDTDYLCETIYPSNATNQTVTWCSSDDSVVEVNTYTGFVRAKKAGIATITACTVDGGYSDSCEVWVHGKTPVFLIHGRISNSTDVWGVNNNIPSGMNDDFKSDINAEALNGKKYIEVDSQEIVDVVVGDCENEDKPCNLGYELQSAGYTEKVNLFAFNYPNEDAVIYSAFKFDSYIDNLISYVRNEGTDEMKACFYASKNDYINNNYKINIVGHSMGGLVARYFIENLYQDNHVDKLITICTPHWGSGYANLSNLTGDLFGIKLHALCDHDLDFDSAMYGGTFSTALNCNAITTNCYNGTYTLTNTLLYSKNRNTKYYAIAAIDYKPENINSNNYTFEIPNNLNTYQSLIDYMTNKSVYKTNIFSNIVPIDLHEVGDNMVGLLSQIGWTENDTASPNKKITMEKIFINVDADGGNGNNIPGLEMLNMLHNKAPHRTCIIEQVNEYLNE